MNKKIKDIVVIGLALFAMFFGAGNVIFPPFLGMESSPDWFIGIIGYILTDNVICCFAIIVMAKNDDSINCITKRIGKIPAEILNIIIILCMGPIIALPRTAAASFDLLMVPIFEFESSGIAHIVFSLAFYVITWCFVIKPNRIIDIVGKILTPLLLTALAIFFIKGIINPIGPQALQPMSQSPLGDGLIAGYQSMDLFGAMCFGALIINTTKDKGYNTRKKRLRVITFATCFAFVLLASTSIALAYLGSTGISEFSDITSQAVLLTKIGMKLFSFGGILIGILATLACLTTSIGGSSGAALYFYNYKKESKKNKIRNYEVIVTLVCCVSFIISTIGFEQIVQLASPVLMTVFPMVVTLTILAFFNNKIKSNRVFIFSGFTALISNIVITILMLQAPELLSYIPLANVNLGWVFPTLLGLCLGFIAGRGHDDRHQLKIWPEIQ